MLNCAILMGRLTADPELRQTPNGISVVTFTLAVNRNFGAKGAERQTDFIDIVAWRSTAEFVSRYFRKGQLVAVEGSIQTRTYQDKQGNNRKAFEVVANQVHFAESKNASQGGGYNAGASSFAPPPAKEPAAQSGSFHQSMSTEFDMSDTGFSLGSNDDFAEVPGDDDLPF